MNKKINLPKTFLISLLIVVLTFLTIYSNSDFDAGSFTAYAMEESDLGRSTRH